MLSQGHILIEDVPGTGKTTLARNLARAFGLSTQRVQCTNELLPSDLLGFNIFNAAQQAMVFQPGPVFSQVLLVDELNRAPSKTQSALLQAMEEGQVTIDGVTHSLPTPFCVIATQNPREQVGVYSLPESQLDRFMVCVEMPRPSQGEFAAMLGRGEPLDPFSQEGAGLLGGGDIESITAHVRSVEVSDVFMNYMLTLVAHIEARADQYLATRYRKQLLRLAQASAVLAQRRFVAPEDLQAVLYPTLRHRLVSMAPSERERFVRSCLNEVPCP